MEGLEDLNGESADEIKRESSKIGFLDELVEVFVEDFELETSMPSKYEGSLQPDNVVSEFRIVENGRLKYLNLNLGLGVEFILIFYDLQSNILSFLVVKSLEDTPK